MDVSESAEVGTSVGLVQATDQDSGEDGRVYYLFVGSSNDRGFSIGSETGIIRVSRRLDRETQNRVVLTVMAKNGGGIRGNDTDEAQVIVSIQDGNDPPEFLQSSYDASVSEGAIHGTRVLTVRAIDKDIKPQNNQFSYSIISGNLGQAFKIDPQTGDIETAKQLDRESMPSYDLTIGAIDTGSPPQTGTAMVHIELLDINDNGPIFDPPEVIGYISENEPAGTSIMILSATDPDLPPNGAPFTYKLIGGKQSEMVTLDKHSGVLRTTRSLDRETMPQLDLTVGTQSAIKYHDSDFRTMKSIFVRIGRSGGFGYTPDEERTHHHRDCHRSERQPVHTEIGTRDRALVQWQNSLRKDRRCASQRSGHHWNLFVQDTSGLELACAEYSYRLRSSY